MNQKELTKTLMMLSNGKNPLVTIVYTKYFSVVEVKGLIWTEISSMRCTFPEDSSWRMIAYPDIDDKQCLSRHR